MSQKGVPKFNGRAVQEMIVEKSDCEKENNNQKSVRKSATKKTTLKTKSMMTKSTSFTKSTISSALKNKTNTIQIPITSTNQCATNIDHAVIVYKSSNVRDVISLSKFVLECDKIQVGGEYLINVNNQLPVVLVEKIDSFQVCNDFVNNSLANSFNQPKTSNSLATSYTQSSSSTLSQADTIAYLKKELNFAQGRVVDLEYKVKRKEDVIQKMSDEITELNNQIIKTRETFGHDHIGKMMRMCKIFIEIFGTVDDLKDIKVFMKHGEGGFDAAILSEKYPEVVAPKQLIEDLVNDHKYNSISLTKTQRKLLKILIGNRDEWLNGYGNITSKFKDECNS